MDPQARLVALASIQWSWRERGKERDKERERIRERAERDAENERELK